MSFINAIVKILPTPIAKIIRKSRIRGECPEYRKLPRNKRSRRSKEHVGKPVDQSQEFFSGGGSQDTIVVETYLTAIHKFLNSFEKKPDVTDLVGDFYIGSKIRHLCQNYIACDIVEPLINSNTEKYSSLDVIFRILDLTKDELPKADVSLLDRFFNIFPIIR